MNPYRLTGFAIVFVILSTWPFTLGRHMSAPYWLILCIAAGQALTLYPNYMRFLAWATARR